MNLKHPVTLASSSPRRQFLLRELGVSFTVAVPGVDESIPQGLAPEEVAMHLAIRKAEVFREQLRGEMILTADTVVLLDGEILNKPENRDDAMRMLTALSGRTHKVITAVSIMTKHLTRNIEEHTNVTFRPLSQAGIEHYIDHNKPFDKAGAYGAQECLPPDMNPCSNEELNFLRRINKLDLIENTISPPGSGLIAIERIDGSYFNVMGFPVHLVYKQLENW